MSYNESRKIKINGMLESLKSFRLYFDGVFGGKGATWEYVMEKLFSLGKIPSKKFDEYLNVKYGIPSDGNDIEWKLIQIIELNNFVLHLNLYVSNLQHNIEKVHTLSLEAQRIISEEISEYIIEVDEKTNYIINYEPRETKAVIDNTKDLPAKIANPIKS